MKKLILLLTICCISTTIEAREQWEPKYNEELIQIYEANEKMREDMALGYIKAIGNAFKNINNPEYQEKLKKESIQKGLEICRSQLIEPLDGKAIPTGQVYKGQYDIHGGELYYLGETTQWSCLMPFIFIPFKAKHKIYCRPVAGGLIDGTLATEKGWITSYVVAHQLPEKGIIYFTPKTK